MNWVVQNQGIIILLLVIAFGAWAYAVVWAANRVHHTVEKLITKMDKLIAAIDIVNRRVTKIEMHLEDKGGFRPYGLSVELPDED